MASYFAFATVMNSIAALTVSGVTIKDVDEIPERVNARDCPILFPWPAGLITNLAVERVSFGSATQARKTNTYNITYRYLHSPMEMERGLFVTMPALVANLDLILSAIVDNDVLTGLLDLDPSGGISIGPIQDAAGNTFHGAELTFAVMNFVR